MNTCDTTPDTKCRTCGYAITTPSILFIHGDRSKCINCGGISVIHYNFNTIQNKCANMNCYNIANIRCEFCEADAYCCENCWIMGEEEHVKTCLNLSN